MEVPHEIYIYTDGAEDTIQGDEQEMMAMWGVR